MWQRLVLGIGNPGPEYERTRHNVGFLVLDRVAEKLGLTFSRLQRRTPEGVRIFGGKVKAQVALSASRDDECSDASGALEAAQASDVFILVKPLTYVNLSGDVAGPMLRAASLAPESIFVVVDDLNLPLGRIRVRPSGRAGGHNGLASIEQALASHAYPRLRLGIGASMDSTLVDHVLAPFLEEEREVLGPSIERAAEATCEWCAGVDLETLMSRYNGLEREEP